MEWAPLPLPSYRPFQGYENEKSIAEGSPDDNTNPFTLLISKADATSPRKRLQLLGGTAAWAENDGHTIYLIGGCSYDRTGREHFTYGNVELMSDDHSRCILRNMVRINLHFSSSSGENTFSVYPERCMGARKYSAIVAMPESQAENTMLLYGGQGNLDW